MSPDGIGKRFSLLLMGETADGAERCAVLSGTLMQAPSGLILDRGINTPIDIRPEWIERIRPVGADVKDILLGAEFYLPLSVGPIPEGASMEGYEKIGLKWPE
jgi:hypothetical protein